MAKTFQDLDTKLIHTGEPMIAGAVSIPIFQSSTFESEGGKSYDAIRYIRLNNTPNHIALHEKLASLENAQAALVFSVSAQTVWPKIDQPPPHVVTFSGTTN